MPWQQVSSMNLKIQLLADYLSRRYSKKDLTDKYKVSRKTAHKWITRYLDKGVNGLQDQSRCSHQHWNQTSPEIVKLALDEKHKNLKRCPKKVRAQSIRKNPDLVVPAASTLARWFKKENLVKVRTRTRNVAAYSQKLCQATAPNQV